LVAILPILLNIGLVIGSRHAKQPRLNARRIVLAIIPPIAAWIQCR